MSRAIFITLLGLIVSSCEMSDQDWQSEQKIWEEMMENNDQIRQKELEEHPEYVLLDQIVDEHISYVKSKYRMWLYGRGGAFMHDIKEIGLDFFIIQESTVDEARKILVPSVERLLKNINASEELRPYLHNFPFTAKNLHYGIGFLDKNHDRQNNGIARILLINGGVSYSLYDGAYRPYKKAHRESYDEALEIVKRDHPELLQQLENSEGES